ncbi:MAG: Sec-independent protein translocase protein TatB [Hyphomicrobiaceae bacterium]
MFDLTSSKLLILAVVALIVVGPKDLPALMRTIGRYMGMIRRQANEFRAQFEDAMRDSELSDLKKEVEQLGEDARSTLRETGNAVESHVGDVTREMNASLSEIDKPDTLEPAPASAPPERTLTDEAHETPALVHEPPATPAAADPGAVAGSPEHEPATQPRSGA